MKIETDTVVSLFLFLLRNYELWVGFSTLFPECLFFLRFFLFSLLGGPPFALRGNVPTIRFELTRLTGPH